jgi:hypothetical protein
VALEMDVGGARHTKEREKSLTSSSSLLIIGECHMVRSQWVTICVVTFLDLARFQLASHNLSSVRGFEWIQLEVGHVPQMFALDFMFSVGIVTSCVTETQIKVISN